jgi:predicted RNA polymerase sigma factor
VPDRGRGVRSRGERRPGDHHGEADHPREGQEGYLATGPGADPVRHDLIAEGHQLVRERLAAQAAPGRYQILAAISAVHTSARDIRDTDWSQAVALYDQLVRRDQLG